MYTQQSPGRARLGKWLVVIGLVVALASAAAMVFSGSAAEPARAPEDERARSFDGGHVGPPKRIKAAGLAVTGGRPRRALLAALVGTAVGVVAAYIPWSFKQTAGSLPYIHDISTDTANPPEFVAAAKLRKPDEHPVAYDGNEVADMQHKAYADLETLTTKAAPEKAFEAAKAAIAAMGMKLVDADPAQGRIEANQTSLLYGFTDDMVVRIAAGADGTKVDVRSKSRVGRSDLGQNAKRIRTFLQKLQANLG